MKSLKFALAAILLSVSAVSFAGPITPGAGWYGFCFANGPTNPATDGCQNQGVGSSGNSFTFALASAGTLNVTDAFVFGDTFDVYINSVFAFTTGGGTHTGAETINPDTAFAGGAYDTGSLALVAGSYIVDIFTHETLGGAGGAYIEVLGRAAPVPEPGILSLVALGLLGVAAARRRRIA
jgi:hypothetical protein